MNLDERKRLHSLTIPELQKELAEAERTFIDFRFDAGLNRLTNPAGMHASRKRIAVLKTLIREKELLAEHQFETMDEYKAYRVAERRTYHERKKARR